MARYGMLAAMHDFIDHKVLGKSSFAPSASTLFDLELSKITGQSQPQSARLDRMEMNLFDRRTRGLHL